MWGFFSHFLTLKFFWDVLKLNKQRSPKAKNWWNSFANFAVFKKDIPHGSELRSLSAPKISKRFSKPSISTAEPAKRSTYTLSYWLLFFGNQQQAEQKYNTWVENLVLIENETGKPQENNAQLSKDTSTQAPESKFPTSVWYHISHVAQVPKNCSP